IISRANLLRAFASASDRPQPALGSDVAIRESLLAELEQQPWWNGYLINIVVTDGTVHLWGIVDSDQHRKAIRIAAENTPGVRDVRDTLSVRTNIPAFV